MKLYGKSPPCFQKERNKGEFSIMMYFLVKISTIFPIVLDLWVLKNFACGAISIVFSRFCVDCNFYRLGMSSQGYSWNMTSKRDLLATNETSSEYFR